MPAENVIFPANKNKRPFIRNWLTEFPWVEYSKKLNGCFCFLSALFYHEIPNDNTMTKSCTLHLLLASVKIHIKD